MDAGQLLPHSERNTTRLALLASTPPVNAAYAIRASLACLPCRSRHQKCDAYQPSCSQCRLKDIECSYAKSRRGGSDNSHKTPQNRADHVHQRRLQGRDSPTTNRELISAVPYIGYPAPSNQRNDSFLPGLTTSHTSGSVVFSSQTAENGATSETLADLCTGTTDLSSSRGLEKSFASESLVDLYYKFFHNAHPFILPKAIFMNRWRCNISTMQPLMLAMQFVGSIYTDSRGPETRSRAFRAVFESSSQPNGYLVQAHLLLAIALHCNDELEDARVSLDMTIRLAVKLGMGTREYAVQHGAGNSVLEESWRRTWWVIFITDCIFAGIRSSPTILLKTVMSTVDLPCEDENYKRGVRHSVNVAR
jgi:hypothetical protein